MPVYAKCQVFTPPEYVKKLLDVVGYRNNLYGKKVAENSCGDGNVLIEIVKRYIKSCLKSNMTINDIRVGLQNDIWAAEIDATHIENCKNRLNKLVERYNIYNVNWNILEGDFLKENITNTFDFVVGNPPYISYKELEPSDRNFVRDTYETCSIGKFDYCYAFIEASIKSLNPNGKLAYLIPSNIFKNRFAQNLRDYFLPYLTDIYDYTSQKIFSGKLTASAIIVCDKKQTNKSFINYHNLNDKLITKMTKSELKYKWIFKSNKFLAEEEYVRFGDYFHAASSIATLLNKAYILDKYSEYGNYITVGDFKLEKKLLRKAVSPRSINLKKEEMVIFPYFYTEKGLQRYSKEQFESLYPQAVEYLNQYKDELKKRKSDDGINWFEYGRSQALIHLNQSKLLISTLITGAAKVYLIDKETIPTSGLYIIPTENQKKYSLYKAKKVLESKLFYSYVASIGVIANGNSYRISPKDINNFYFPMDMLIE